MALHVQRQVVRTGEAATAGDAFERFRARVFAVMPRQFIRSGEAPVTSLPTAPVWLLTYKNKQARKDFVKTIIFLNDRKSYNAKIYEVIYFPFLSLYI